MTQTHHSDPFGTATLDEPVRNIDRLTDHLWVGGDLPHDAIDAANTIQWWHQLGIRTIIDARAEWSDERLVRAIAPDIRYAHLGQDDVGQQIPGTWFDMVADAAQAGFEADHAVLAHCHMGINRGPSAAFAILLSLGWDPIEAIGHIRRERPVAAVAYAEDALAWWHGRADATDSQRHADRERLAQWRTEHPHDTIRIIRQIRLTEQSERSGR